MACQMHQQTSTRNAEDEKKQKKPCNFFQILGFQASSCGQGFHHRHQPLSLVRGWPVERNPRNNITAVRISEPNFSPSCGQSDASYSQSYSLRRSPAISLPRILALRAAGPKGQIDRSSELQRCVASLVRESASLLGPEGSCLARWGQRVFSCRLFSPVSSFFFKLDTKTWGRIRQFQLSSVRCEASLAAKDQCSLPQNPRRVATLNTAGAVSLRRSTVY